MDCTAHSLGRCAARRFAHFFNIYISRDRRRKRVGSLQNLSPSPFAIVSCNSVSAGHTKSVGRDKVIRTTASVSWLLDVMAMQLVALDSSGKQRLPFVFPVRTPEQFQWNCRSVMHSGGSFSVVVFFFFFFSAEDHTLYLQAHMFSHPQKLS